MALSKRERYIAIGTSVVVGLLAFDYFALSPYLESRASLRKDITLQEDTRQHGRDTLDRQKKLDKVWQAMQAGGLKANASAAESQILQALNSWAEASRLSVVSIRPERNTTEGKFQLISFRVTGTGGSRSITNMLWQMESANIPVRINDVEISPKQEGTDNLQIQFGVSTLCQLPEAEKSKTPGPVAREDR